MFYSFLKILVRFTLKIFYRKIYISGLEHVDINKAQLVASNHPNGFLEPLVMACFFPKPLHFLVRGDVFDNPLLRPILKSTNQLPIFRFRDGFSKLRENSHTMDESIRVLLDKKNLLIFAEGGTESIKKLRPLQKGISRIAFQVMEKNPDLDLEILPVGINFTYPTAFNSEVMLKIGQPLKVKKYLPLFLSDPKQAHEVILHDLYHAMKQNVIHLEDQSRISIFEKLVILKRIAYQLPYLPVHLTSDQRLYTEKGLAEITDSLSDTALHDIKENVTILEKSLKEQSITLTDLLKSPMTVWRCIFLITGFLPALLGGLLHWLPIYTGYYFTKSKVRQKEFKASILMVSCLILLLLLYIIWGLMTWIFALPLYLTGVFILSGLWLRWYYDIWSTTTLISAPKIQEARHRAADILDHIYIHHL